LRSTMLSTVLITGFLGSGKTTLLEHLARSDPRRLLFLVNEFSSVDVDGPRLRQVASEVRSLVGGSVFCRCLVTEFIRVLGEMVDRAERAEPAFAGLVIEASGMANPAVVNTLLAETGLDRRLQLQTIVTLVDPATFPRLRATLPVVVEQVRCADVILLNKADCYASRELDDGEGELRQINASALIHRTIHARMPIDPLSARRGQSPAGLGGEYAAGRDPLYIVVRVTLPQPVDLRRLEVSLRRHAAHLFRVKGQVAADGDWYRVDQTDSGFECRSCAAPEPPVSELVCVASASAEEELCRAFAYATRVEVRR